MLNVTDRAVDAIRGVCTDGVQGLRIMVEAGGCSGLQYKMGLETDEQSGDEVLDFEGVKVFIDGPSVLWLTGATMDFVDNAQGAGFVFDNPNAGSKCSCGKSFS
jgi:iron-sulfur cluster assembly protein